MTAYYNEIDPYAAQWLRNLIKAGHIAPGDVDERSIVDVRADDLAGYEQCHFFAGIGGWSVALRLAGWADDRPVWTGSCPCQPFSAAGAGKAADDSRHLWPAWFPLIAKCRPATVFGEQVEAAIGWGWLDVVFSDLEGEGYACGATVLPACGVGAPHIRQRTWFVANAECGAAERHGHEMAGPTRRVQGEARKQRLWADIGDGGNIGPLEHSARTNERRHGREPRSTAIARSSEARPSNGNSAGGPGSMGNPDGAGHEVGIRHAGNDGSPLGSAGRQATIETSTNRSLEHAGSIGRQRREGTAQGREHDGPDAGRQQGHDGPIRSSETWACDWLPCTDGKARPVEPGTFPLAHGIPSRVGRLRAYGNAIVPQVAAEFIAAFTDDDPPR